MNTEHFPVGLNVSRNGRPLKTAVKDRFILKAIAIIAAYQMAPRGWSGKPQPELKAEIFMLSLVANLL